MVLNPNTEWSEDFDLAFRGTRVVGEREELEWDSLLPFVWNEAYVPVTGFLLGFPSASVSTCPSS